MNMKVLVISDIHGSGYYAEKIKEIIEKWLCESGTAYMRRRSRSATKNSYERCVRMYFALVIHNCAR